MTAPARSPSLLRRTSLLALFAVVGVAATMLLGSPGLGTAHSSPATPAPHASTGWAQLAPAVSPPGLAVGGAMAYDPSDGYLVLFGGCASGDFWFSTCTPTNGTWAYQNGSWTQLTPTVSPPARYYSSLAWDSEDHALVLFGGNGTAATGFLNDTWTFVHGQWTQQHPLVHPLARAAAGMVYDARDGYVLLVDGEQFRNLTYAPTNTYVGADFNDSWTYSGGNWTLLHPTDNPSARDSVGITYDATLGEVVLFGGFNWTTYNLDDTWTFHSGVWASVTLSAANGTYPMVPPPRNNPSLAYDPSTGTDVLFGGHTGFQYYGDTWEFNGTVWVPSNTTTSPSARWGSGLAYDPGASCLILYGGYVASAGSIAPVTYLNDTWGFDCSNSSGGSGGGNGSGSGNSSGGGNSSGSGNGSSGGNGSGSGHGSGSGNGSGGGNGSSGGNGSGAAGGSGHGAAPGGIASPPSPPTRQSNRAAGPGPISTPSLSATPVGGGSGMGPMVSPLGFLLYVAVSVGLLAFVVVVRRRPPGRR